MIAGKPAVVQVMSATDDTLADNILIYELFSIAAKLVSCWQQMLRSQLSRHYYHYKLRQAGFMSATDESVHTVMFYVKYNNS